MESDAVRIYFRAMFVSQCGRGLTGLVSNVTPPPTSLASVSSGGGRSASFISYVTRNINEPKNQRRDSPRRVHAGVAEPRAAKSYRTLCPPYLL
ncbi:hypothetical protein EVAR_89623_1 [Eumeta japonica]|uniref:Uncharacterized protein n=1 Tax=Eumeta variegata TaxID=151549 RepID=A0A4C1ZEY6_EUMVA|nr:hypothetical protein EVAR_89623_1 [Eumeta japonica]